MLLPSLPGEAPGAPRPITIREAAAFTVSLASLAMAAWWNRLPGGLFRFPVLLPAGVGAATTAASSSSSSSLASLSGARAASTSPSSPGAPSSAAVSGVSITGGGGAGDFWGDVHEGRSVAAGGAEAYRLPLSMNRAARETPQAVL